MKKLWILIIIVCFLFGWLLSSRKKHEVPPETKVTAEQVGYEIRQALATYHRINKEYFDRMCTAQTVEEKYSVFYELRLKYLLFELESEIKEMKNPLLHDRRNVFPSIVTYSEDEEKWESCPLRKDYFESYQAQTRKIIASKKRDSL